MHVRRYIYMYMYVYVGVAGKKNLLVCSPSTFEGEEGRMIGQTKRGAGRGMTLSRALAARPSSVRLQKTQKSIRNNNMLNNSIL